MPPKKAVKKATKPEAKAKAVRKRTQAVKPKAKPETQAQAQQQTVIVNLAEAKKITRRRRKSKAKPSEPVVDAYSLARPVAVYQTSQSSQTNQLFDTIRVMNSLLEQKASMPLVMPVQSIPEQNYNRLRWGAEPIPEEPVATRVAKTVTNVAGQAEDVAEAIGTIAGAVQTGAEAVGAVQGAVGAVRQVQRQPEAPAQQGSLREAYTMLFGEPAPPPSMGAVELSLPASPAPERARETIKATPSRTPRMPAGMPEEYTADWPERLPSHDEMNMIINENPDVFKGKKTRTKALSQTIKYALLRDKNLI